MADCSSCNGLTRLALLERSRTCEPPDYFSPGDIYFCPHQMQWLIENIGILQQFQWVTDADTNFPKRSRPQGKGYFETPADFAFEVERRLEHCRVDGLLPYLHYAFDFPTEDLAKYYNLSEKAVEYRIEVVKWYISGWNFRQSYRYRRDNAIKSYENWLRQ